MDPRLLQYYNRELQHVQEIGAEFAKEYPKIAGRLGMETLPCADPYVERLLEGFAFMAARIQLKLDAEYPRFTQHLLEMLFPHYLSPVPSMMVVRMQPDQADPSLMDGHRLPRDTILRGIASKGERTACEYRTAHEVTLWPVELSEARYFPTASALANIEVEGVAGARAGIRFRLRCTAGAFDQTRLEQLPVYLPGSGDVPRQLYEQLLGNCCGVVVRPKGGSRQWQERLPASAVRRHGFEPSQALLPYTRRSFDGYRLLQEYFAFPKRFFFFELDGLGPAVRRCSSTELEIIVLLNRSLSWMESAVDADEFALYCTPAINLFPKRADRIAVDKGRNAYHVLPDRTRPMDYEVHSILRVDGFSGGAEVAQRFRAFYTARDPAQDSDQLAYFTTTREPRALSSRQRREGTRSSYVGSEVFLSIVDGNEAPFSPDLKQLEVFTLCTNRDLPLQLTLGTGATDFALDVGAPIEAIRCVDKVTTPRPSPAQRGGAWQLLSHLSLNYLGLVQDDEAEGARAMRDMLSLYTDDNDAVLRKLVEGVRSISSQAIVRRLPEPGPITFARGLEITLTCEEAAFEGTGVFLFGSVLEEFLARYVSLNSFTETVLKTHERGEIMRWPARIGRRQRL